MPAKKPVKRATTPRNSSVVRSYGEQEPHYWVYDDLISITGKTRDAIHKASSRKDFDAKNLKSVIAWSVRHAKPEFKLELLPYVMLHNHSKNPAQK